MKTSLAQQRQACEHLIALCAKSADETVIAAAKDACRSLAWFERKRELTLELVRLDKEAPALAAILKEFPDAYISDVRPRFDRSLTADPEDADTESVA